MTVVPQRIQANVTRIKRALGLLRYCPHQPRTAIVDAKIIRSSNLILKAQAAIADHHNVLPDALIK